MVFCGLIVLFVDFLSSLEEHFLLEFDYELAADSDEAIFMVTNWVFKIINI